MKFPDFCASLQTCLSLDVENISESLKSTITPLVMVSFGGLIGMFICLSSMTSRTLSHATLSHATNERHLNHALTFGTESPLAAFALCRPGHAPHHRMDLAVHAAQRLQLGFEHRLRLLHRVLVELDRLGHRLRDHLVVARLFVLGARVERVVLSNNLDLLLCLRVALMQPVPSSMASHVSS